MMTTYDDDDDDDDDAFARSKSLYHHRPTTTTTTTTGGSRGRGLSHDHDSQGISKESKWVVGATTRVLWSPATKGE